MSFRCNNPRVNRSSCCKRTVPDPTPTTSPTASISTPSKHVTVELPHRASIPLFAVFDKHTYKYQTIVPDLVQKIYLVCRGPREAVVVTINDEEPESFSASESHITQISDDHTDACSVIIESNDPLDFAYLLVEL